MHRNLFFVMQGVAIEEALRGPASPSKVAEIENIVESVLVRNWPHFEPVKAENPMTDTRFIPLWKAVKEAGPRQRRLFLTWCNRREGGSFKNWGVWDRYMNGRVVRIWCWPELFLEFIQFLLGLRIKQPMTHQDPMLADHSVFSLCAQEEIRPGRSVNVLHLPCSPTEGSADDLTIFFVHGSMANMQQYEGQVDPHPRPPSRPSNLALHPHPPALLLVNISMRTNSAPASIAPGPRGKRSANKRRALNPPPPNSYCTSGGGATWWHMTRSDAGDHPNRAISPRTPSRK